MDNLFSSVKVVAGAAEAAYNMETDKIDKPKVAGAAEDLLDAASDYGKLKEKGYGEYVEKGDGFLDKYKTSSTTSSTAPPKQPTEAPKEAEGEKSGGGLGDALKMAEGFFKF